MIVSALGEVADIAGMGAMDRVHKIDSRTCWAPNAHRKATPLKIKAANQLQVRSLMHSLADPTTVQQLKMMNLIRAILIRLSLKVWHLATRPPVMKLEMTIENSQTCPQALQIVNCLLSSAAMIRALTRSRESATQRSNYSIDLSKLHS